ncbi:MFS transporter [Candidatus Shapirobacteria bacterium]|nr:MFS transporter [Candidatus Shapirobacteria bacterium]
MAFKLKKLGNVKLLSLFYVFYNFRLYSVLEVIYFYQITHSYTLALSLFSVAQISQGLFEIPLGYYSDKHGRSNCLRAGAVASLLSIILYAIGQNYFVLLVGVIFDGINMAAFSGNNDALLYETLAEQNKKSSYHHEYGKINSWLELSGFVGVFVGSLLVIKSLSLLFVISIIPRVIATVISLGFVDPKVEKKPVESALSHLKESWMIYKNNMKVRLLSLTDIIGYIGGVTWNFQSAFYNLFLPTWATSMVMSINFFTSFVSFRLAGKLIQKYEAIRVLFYTEVYSRALTLIAFIFPTIASPFMIATASVTYGPSTVAKSTILQNEFTNEQRATMTSINSFVGNIIYSISAVLVGMAADRFGVARALLVVQLLMVSVGVIYYRLKNID